MTFACLVFITVNEILVLQEKRNPFDHKTEKKGNVEWRIEGAKGERRVRRGQSPSGVEATK